VQQVDQFRYGRRDGLEGGFPPGIGRERDRCRLDGPRLLPSDERVAALSLPLHRELDWDLLRERARELENLTGVLALELLFHFAER
jgi:hypothetical protein